MIFDIDFAVKNFFVALTGVPITLLVTFVAIAAGLPLAFLIAVGRQSEKGFLSQILALYISFFRGVPVIVLIFLIYYGLPGVMKTAADTMGISFNPNHVNPLIYAFIVFILNASASFAEMWKAALSSVGRGQMEAAEMAGLSKTQAYIHVVLPQAFATAAPSFCSITLSTLKETSLVFMMTVQDITARAKIAAGLEYRYVEGFVDALLVYVIVCYTLEFLLKKWEVYLTAYRTVPSKTVKSSFSPVRVLGVQLRKGTIN